MGKGATGGGGADTIVVLTRTRAEWVTYTLGVGIGGAVLGTIFGTIVYAFLNGTSTLGFGGAVPSLSAVGIFAFALGGLCASVAAVVLRPRRISVRGRAATGGTSGLGGSRYWRDHFAPDGAADGATGGAGEAAVTE